MESPITALIEILMEKSNEKEEKKNEDLEEEEFKINNSFKNKIYNPVPKKNYLSVFSRLLSPKKASQSRLSSPQTYMNSSGNSIKNLISPGKEDEEYPIWNNTLDFKKIYVKNNSPPKFKKIDYGKFKSFKSKKTEPMSQITSLNIFNSSGCNCKSSKCLKLYCKCFQSNKGCQNCNCVGCENIENSEARKNAIKNLNVTNPLSLKKKEVEAQKFYSEKDNQIKYTLTLSMGCNCKNSKCQKKYCECFKYGLNCSPKCKCQSCLNSKINDDKQEDPLIALQKRNLTNVKEELLNKLLTIKNFKFKTN
jgi:hypothetical protein